MALMPLWTWIALGIFLAVGIVAAAMTAVLALRAYRSLRDSQSHLLEALERLTADADALAARTERTTARIDEVEARFAAVRRSAENLGVLKWALGDSLGAVSRLRQAVPRK